MSDASEGDSSVIRPSPVGVHAAAFAPIGM